MYCKNCGKQIGINIRVCPECGAEVTISKSEEKKSKSILHEVWLYIGFAILVIFLICSAMKGDPAMERAEEILSTLPTSTGSSTFVDSAPTKSQKNALARAKQYLDILPYSKQGLIEQLEYEKYSHTDAVYAVEHCGADWYEQAVEKAKDYLDLMPYSHDGLVDQLVYEGFTREQALYGAKQNGL